MKYICIVIPRFEQVNLDIPFSDITIKSFIKFNRKEANLIGVEQMLEYNEIRFYFTHPEFENVPPFCACMIYRINEARKRYPFLFADTNPLLYRKFK